MATQKLVLTEEMTARHTEKLKNWFDVLSEVMPSYFFNAFDSEMLQLIMPALFNIERQEGIQQITSGNNVILIYLKSEKNKMSTTARMMKNHDIFSASIHESAQSIIVNGEPRTLVIEHYVVDKLSMKMAPLLSKAEIKKAYKSLYKKVPAEFDEIYDRINWEAAKDLTADRVAQRLHTALRTQCKDALDLDIEKVGKDEMRITMSLSNCPSRGFYYKIAECLSHYGFEITRRYSRAFTFQEDESDFYRMPVTINTTYIKTPKGRDASKRLEDLAWELPHIKWTDMEDLYYSELVNKKGWCLSDANLIRAAGEFAHSQFSYIDRNAYNSHDIERMCVLYEYLLKDFLNLFVAKFKPGETSREKSIQKLEKKITSEIDRINTGMQEKDVLVKNIFRAMLNFFNNVKKTNFYVKEKTALSFRLDPAFMSFYEKISDVYPKAFPAKRPYGVFFFINHNTVGFQVRFSKIARGGWRTVIPRTVGHELEKMDMYGFTKDEIFREVYVLAHTQHMKNKDIYEGGSKMICLLKQEDKFKPSNLYESQRSICRAFLDLINYDKKGKLDPNIVDTLDEFEIIEIGPDENMFDVMIEWMGKYAEDLGYTLGGGLISGKPETGFNHKDYGVTSLGVHQYLLKTLSELGYDPGKDEFSVKISGGPFGDVAGNEIKLLLEKKNGKFIYPNLKIVAITDGPAAAYDPNGLDKEELLSMVKMKNLDKFNSDKLKGEGAYIIYSEPIVKDGRESHTMVCVKNKKNVKKQISRDEFMEMFQDNLTANYADIFIPCGGRPSTINESNWENYFQQGKASSKAIVEGANSYITPGARSLIQDKGVWIVKDASANKCGVITSSYEILSGLTLGKENFIKLKKQLASEVLDILVERARKEADWLFFQFKKSKKHLTDLTELLSVHINDKNSEIAAYLEKNPKLVDRKIILEHLPKTFKKQKPELIDNLPEDYKKAIVSVELACRIVYKSAQDLESEIKSVL